jgi:alkanesulfonate monooxygenase SsuD/methylene tetrahydromethanopterin reductase-like flavin-dependent oxidoreductase (luciferase family)
MPAYRASLDRAGLSGPADTVVVGDESTIADALARYRDAGATDLVVASLGSPEDRARTLDVATAFRHR